MTTDVGRIVALGASNLTRGFQTLVSTARGAWGPYVEVLAALGHGRSYGAPSRLVFRTLPGILESGLWRELESRPQVPTRALVTNVGNDILYSFSAEKTLAWVAEALGRLARFTRDIVVTDLPLASIRRLSRTKFLVFRSILAPSCRLSLAQVLETAERVNASSPSCRPRTAPSSLVSIRRGTGSTPSTFALLFGVRHGRRSSAVHMR